MLVVAERGSKYKKKGEEEEGKLQIHINASQNNQDTQ